MIEVSKRAASELKEVVREPRNQGKKPRLTFDTGG
jgi:Fe-S cluster assembly iron-binding protein IscA